jgi:glucan phosphoethanolaminetransferase (alkaline phosphatase superfamily)
MIFLYKIIFILTAFGAGVIAVDVFLKITKQTIFERLFGLMSMAFVMWASGRFLVLSSNLKIDALFWVHFLYIGSIFVHVLFLHTILVFLDISKKPLNKALLCFFYTLGGVLLLANMSYFFTGKSYLIADMVSKDVFKFYEVPSKLYLLHLVDYLFIPSYCFFLMLFKYFEEVGEKKQQIKLVLFASIVGFLGGNSVVPLVYDINIPPNSFNSLFSAKEKPSTAYLDVA